MKKQKLKKIIIISGIVVLATLAVFGGNYLGWWSGKVIKIENQSEENKVTGVENKNSNEEQNQESENEGENESENTSPISGLECENAARRPMAVMISGNSEARPLSGLSEADLVVEMPVITGGITRMMAVYVCGDPETIGSLRSARHDFIPLAMGLDAIFAHWGGSHFALDKLNAGIMDNINAIVDYYGAFYRQPGIARPHNGFTSMKRLFKAAKRFGYRLENNFEGYPHYTDDDNSLSGDNKDGILKINYPYPWNLEYRYQAKDNSYFRWRGGKKEIDKNNSEQIKAKNIVVMRAASRQIEGQYNDVDVEGEGKAIIYNNGEEISGRWKKDKNNKKSKLYFYDDSGAEIKFVPGQIWVEIVELGQGVDWK